MSFKKLKKIWPFKDWGRLEEIDQILLNKRSLDQTFSINPENLQQERGELERKRNFYFQFWIGIVSMAVSILALALTTFYSHRSSVLSYEEFKLRNRPYLILKSLDQDISKGGNFIKVTIINAGEFPARIASSSLKCLDARTFIPPEVTLAKYILAKGSSITMETAVKEIPTSGIECNYQTSYSLLTKKVNEFETSFRFKAFSDGTYKLTDEPIIN